MAINDKFYRVLDLFDLIRDGVFNVYQTFTCLIRNHTYELMIGFISLSIVAMFAHEAKNLGYGRQVAEFGYSLFISMTVVIWFHVAKWAAQGTLIDKAKVFLIGLVGAVTTMMVRSGWFSLSRFLADVKEDVLYSLPPVEQHWWFWAHRPEMALVTGVSWVFFILLLLIAIEPMNKRQIAGVIGWAVGLGLLLVAL